MSFEFSRPKVAQIGPSRCWVVSLGCPYEPWKGPDSCSRGMTTQGRQLSGRNRCLKLIWFSANLELSNLLMILLPPGQLSKSSRIFSFIGWAAASTYVKKYKIIINANTLKTGPKTSKTAGALNCCHIGYSFRLAATALLYAPSHRQDSTYHSLCYTSHGALAGTRNSSMGPPWRIDLMTHCTMSECSYHRLHHEWMLLPQRYISLLCHIWDILVAYDNRLQYCLNYNKYIFCLTSIFLYLLVSFTKE